MLYFLMFIAGIINSDPVQFSTEIFIYIFNTFDIVSCCTLYFVHNRMIELKSKLDIAVSKLKKESYINDEEKVLIYDYLHLNREYKVMKSLEENIFFYTSLISFFLHILAIYFIGTIVRLHPVLFFVMLDPTFTVVYICKLYMTLQVVIVAYFILDTTINYERKYSRMLDDDKDVEV